MPLATDALKQKFRDGRHAEAVAECEALLAQHPGDASIKRLCATMHGMTRNFARSLELLRQVRDPAHEDADVLFNIGMCERELQDIAAAAQTFRDFTAKFPAHADGWASLAECRLRLGEFREAAAAADRALQLDGAFVPALTVRGQALKALGDADKALAAFNAAIQLAPQLPQIRVHRADLFESAGRTEEAAQDYAAALRQNPFDDAALRKATACLLTLGKGPEGIQLCRDVQKANPDSITAKLGAEWLLGQMVPLWHVPMMNEDERNQPYYDGLKAAVAPGRLVFEIGTGSGLLSMMAAQLGAQQVVTCEAERLVAETARKIVERNKLQDRITVLAKPSYQVQVGTDLPRKADILVHEIFSSELLGEHVLPALEDAKARLLEPGGIVLPATASLMIALVGGDELGKELHVGESFGFDLTPFNAIHPKKRPIHREDLPRVLLSADVEAFRFDFCAQDTFPAEKKQIDIPVTKAGACWGVIQWIRFEFGHGIAFENHPSQRRPVASWQHTIYRFDDAQVLQVGDVVKVGAAHDRSRPWFDRVR